MRTTAFWALYVGITILIGSVCHYHTAVEGRPGKSPAGKTVVTKQKHNKNRGTEVRRKMTAAERLAKERELEEQGLSYEDVYPNEDKDYVEPCVGVCQYHRELKWKRDNGITDPPVSTTSSTTQDPAERTTKDYGRNAKEIGRGSAVPGTWPGRGPGIYIAAMSSILTVTISSFLVGSKASKQLYYSGGGKWVQSLKPL